MDYGEASKLRLITFLGTGKYSEVKYIWNSPEGKANEFEPTSFFPEVITKFLGIREILVLVTQKAREGDNFKELQKRLKGKLKVIHIPAGKEESELWEIFNSIVSEVKENDEIVLDITHGFRSIPMVVFSVADYLRKTKSVVIRYILYGAYEAGSAESPDGIKRVPVFDLTPLLDLIDWTGGLETFLRRGEAMLIGEKMREKQASLYRRRDSHVSPPKELQGVGAKLQTFSLSLHLARPQEVLKDAYDLLELLKKAKNELSEWAKPFTAIIEQVQKELEAFAYKNVDNLTRENLERQRALLRYYVDKGLMIQAVLLAREWMVSYVIYLVYGQCRDWTDPKKREEAENRLNIDSGDSSLLSWRGGELPSDLSGCWKSLADLRNDLAHCGMRKNPRSAKDFKSALRDIIDKLNSLPLEPDSGGR